MALPKLPFGFLSTTKQLISGMHINYLGLLMTGSTTGITARAGGALNALTPQAQSAFNELTTVASANDSFMLPPAKSGLRICITNSGANSAQIFGAFGTVDTVQGQPTATGVALAAAATAMFVCTKDGVWLRFISS